MANTILETVSLLVRYLSSNKNGIFFKKKAGITKQKMPNLSMMSLMSLSVMAIMLKVRCMKCSTMVI